MYFVDLMFGRSKFMIAAIIVLISVTALIVGVYFLGKYGKELFARINFIFQVLIRMSNIGFPAIGLPR